MRQFTRIQLNEDIFMKYRIFVQTQSTSLTKYHSLQRGKFCGDKPQGQPLNLVIKVSMTSAGISNFYATNRKKKNHLVIFQPQIA